MKTLNSINKRLKQLNPTAILYYFCLTVVIVRGSIMVLVWANHDPGIYFRGWHLHHFFWGFLCLILTFDEYLRKKMLRWMAEILFGLSLGLIFDEFGFWGFGLYDNYWNRFNFLAVLLLSLVAVILSKYDEQPYLINLTHKKTKKKILLPKQSSFGKSVMLPWASFVFIWAIFFVLK